MTHRGAESSRTHKGEDGGGSCGAAVTQRAWCAARVGQLVARAVRTRVATLGSEWSTSCAVAHITADNAALARATIPCMFVCNAQGEDGGSCGFDFMDNFLNTQLQTDTRCE